MSKVILIIAGVLILLLLLFLLVARTPNIRQRISSLRSPVVIIVVLVLMAALLFISLKLFLPRGENSLFADTVVGETSETEEVDQETTENPEETGGGFSLERAQNGNAAGDEMVYVTVTENACRIGTTVFTDLLELKDVLVHLKEQGASFALVDDYAYSKQYSLVRDMLEELKIAYEEIQK